MPTSLPSRRPGLDTRRAAALLILLARLRLLDWRMEQVTRRLARRPSERDDARLLAGARTWLRLTERGAALAGVPEPPEAAELRAVFRAQLDTIAVSSPVHRPETSDAGKPASR